VTNSAKLPFCKRDKVYLLSKHNGWRIMTATWESFEYAYINNLCTDNWYATYAEAEAVRNKILGKTEEKYERKA
jgi:hypothetical protein